MVLNTKNAVPSSRQFFLLGYTPETLTSDFMIRSLRRRLWHALQQSDVETSWRAYQCSYQEFQDWLEEENSERISLLKESKECTLSKKKNKSQRRIEKKSSNRNIDVNSSNDAAFHSIEVNRIRGPILAHVLSSSEPFIADDYLSPYDMKSYQFPAKKELPPTENKKGSIKKHTRRKRLATTLGALRLRKLRASDEPPAWDEDLNRREAAMNNPDTANEDRMVQMNSRSQRVDEMNTQVSLKDLQPEAPSFCTTPLHEAARLGAVNLIRLLLAQGGDPNVKNGMDRTALHMAAGGCQIYAESDTKAVPGIRPPILPTSAIIALYEESSKNVDRLSKMKPLQWFGHRKHKSHFSKMHHKSMEASFDRMLSMDDLNQSHADRMDSVISILSWWNPESGDGLSINAVDVNGRTALHYASELGRDDICLSILSTFGAMLTVVDESGKTPCELASINSFHLLSAQLEARALLYVDPYGVDDELMAELLQSQGNSSGASSKRKLVAPFSFFDTISLENVESERSKCLKRVRSQLLAIVSSYDFKEKKMDQLMLSAQEVGLSAALQGMYEASDSVKSESNENCINNSARPTSIQEIMANAVNASLEAVDSESASIKKRTLERTDTQEDPIEQSAKLRLYFSRLGEAHVDQYMAYHRWDMENALLKFRLNPKKAFLDANIYLPTNETRNTGQVEKACLICYDETVGTDEWFALKDCVHGFCVECLVDYLRDCAAKMTPLSLIVCPHHECKCVLNPHEVSFLLKTEVDTSAKIRRATNEHFVTTSNNLKFCPSPGCNGIVKRSAPKNLKKHGIAEHLIDYTGAVCTAHTQISALSSIDDSVVCPITYEGMEDMNYHDCWSLTSPRRAHRFCFSCCESPHWPVPCEMLEKWKEKIHKEFGVAKSVDGEESTPGHFADQAQKLWIKTNTRPCPKCDIPIEKDDGCNHMTCTSPTCRHEFCWICRKDWSLHSSSTGGFFRCNIWQENEDVDTNFPTTGANQGSSSNNRGDDQGYGTAIHAAKESRRIRKEVARLVHHFTRYEAHFESAALEKKMSDMTCARLAPVVQAAEEFDGSANFNFCDKGISFIHDAFIELLECRSVLQHSYALSFFRYSNAAKNEFRGIQGHSRRRELSSFERLQCELEMLTEQMSDIVARRHIRATRVQILFLTASTAEKRQDFSNLVLSILQEGQKQEAMKPQYSFAKRESSLNFSNAIDSAILDNEENELIEGQRLDHHNTAHNETEASREIVDEDVPMWECSACTYMNNIQGSGCAMCGTRR